MIRFRKFVAVFAALAAFSALSVAAPQPAQAQTLEQARSVGEWAQQFQRIVAGFIVPLQQLPDPPAEGMTRAERLAWAGVARQWATNAQASFSAARADLQTLPASPPAHDALSERLRAAIESALPRLREALDAGDRIASAYVTLADAVERNQMDRVNSIRVTAIEAALVSTRLFQDTNAAQAAAFMDGNPQGPLTRSYAHSYEALWAILNYRRDLMSGATPNRQGTAEAMAAAAQNMRVAVAEGRADIQLVNTQLATPAIVATIDPALVPRLRAVASTFPGSFVREEEIAGDFEGIVALLRGPRSGDEMEAAIDVYLDSFANRDTARVDDINRRTAIMTAP